MEAADAINTLNVFANWPSAFSVADVSDFATTDLALGRFSKAILKDKRFLRIGEGPIDKVLFLPEITLFKWFARLNIELAQARVFNLTEKRLGSLFNRMRRNGTWAKPPVNVLDWGDNLGLVASGSRPGVYVFPLANVLSYILPSVSRIVCYEIREFAAARKWRRPFGPLINNYLNEGFSNFPQRQVEIVQDREGLAGRGHVALDKLGAEFGVSRERIRQIEKNFWRSVSKKSTRIWRPFFVAFLYDFFHNGGTLISNIGTGEGVNKKFLAKVVGVPFVILKGIGLLVFGVPRKRKKPFHGLDLSATILKPYDLAVMLEAELGIVLSVKDMKLLTESALRAPKKSLNICERLYLTLRTIGKPAHYSTIAEYYNHSFPDMPMSDHNVHAALGRSNKYGIVWVGVRGTFALKEWGYKQPSIRLFDAVTEIVKKIYEKTRKPVPYTVIASELAKYRKLVNPNSLKFATIYNRGLKQVSTDYFIPASVTCTESEDVFAAHLDRILNDFGENN